MTNIFDEKLQCAVILRFSIAQAIEQGPIARAHLDHRVPIGFHALWKPRP